MIDCTVIHNTLSLHHSTVFSYLLFLLGQSREYKYNRQVFDANAQLWTEKYANSAAIGASGWGSVDATVLVRNSQFHFTNFVFQHFYNIFPGIYLSFHYVLKF